MGLQPRSQFLCKARIAGAALWRSSPVIRVLDAFGFQGGLEGRTPRTARILLFRGMGVSNPCRNEFTAI